MDALERDVAACIATDPLRHAALVHDLIYDRAARPARSIDPLIVSRHRAEVIRDMAPVARRNVKDDEGDASHMRAMAQAAVSYAVEHTHRAMMAMGHAAETGDRGALAGGRILFAATISGEVADAMVRSGDLQ